MSNQKSGIKQRGRPARTAAEELVTDEPRTREDEELARMMQRGPMGVALQLEIPQTIKKGLISEDCQARWVLERNVPKNQNFDWIMVQNDGKNVSMPSGDTVLYLMKLPTKVFNYRKKLEMQTVNERTGEEVRKGMDYVPDDRDSAVTVERY